MSQSSDKQVSAETAASRREDQIPAELGVRVTRDAGVYISGAVITLFLALVNVAVITRFLDPAEFGELAILLTFAAFLTVIYNLGTLQGTFMWVFGSSGEEEMEDDALESESGSKRRALSTGLVLTLMIACLGTAAVAATAPWMAELVLGSSSDSDLLLLAAVSGASGAAWRLVSNLLRMERRPRGYVLLNTVRPVLVLGIAIPLVASGGGVEGAILGTAIGGWLSVAVGLAATWASFEPALSRRDLIMILKRGASYIPIIASFWIAQNVDLYALSKFTPDAEVGLYRLAGRFGAFLSYFSSALFMAWSPLVRTPTFAAATQVRGRDLLGGTFVTYFVMGGAFLVLALTVGADLLVRIAPPAYADAAPLIPLVAAGFLVHGLLIAIYRVSKFKRKRLIYISSAMVSAAVFLVAALLIIPPLGAYGAALSVIIGFLVGTALIGSFSQRGADPLRIEWPRIMLGLGLAGACLAAAKGLGELAGDWRPAIELAALCSYPVLLAYTGVLPREEMKEIWKVIRTALSRKRPASDVRSAVEAHDPQELAVLHQGMTLRWKIARTNSVEGLDPGAHAELVRILRRLDGAELTTEQDQQIGEYLFAELPVAERDALARALWALDVEPAEVHRLEQILLELRRLPAEAWERGGVTIVPISRRRGWSLRSRSRR
jgi:O-antigen/teichoic acid export membrane protein